MNTQKSDSQDFFSRNAADIVGDIDREMSRGLRESAFTTQEKLALSCRILADEGHARTLAGQITVRADASGGYWTTPFGFGFGEITSRQVLRMDGDMRTVEGVGNANPAVRFHLWVYRARPEVNCIVHTHPPHVAALSMLDRPLSVAHMDATVFHEDCAWLRDWPGVPLANEEGRLISEALGSKRAILLAHHGLLTTGRTLEEAVYLAVLLEQAAQLQLLAQSVGEIRPMRGELAREAHDFLLKDAVVRATFAYWARRVAQRYPEAV